MESVNSVISSMFTVGENDGSYDYVLKTVEVPSCKLESITCYVSHGLPLIMSNQTPRTVVIWTEYGVLCVAVRAHLGENLWILFVFNDITARPRSIDNLYDIHEKHPIPSFIFGKKVLYVDRLYTVNKAEFDGDKMAWNIFVYWLMTKMQGHNLTSFDMGAAEFTVKYIKQLVCAPDGELMLGLYESVRDHKQFLGTLEECGLMEPANLQAGIMEGRQYIAGTLEVHSKMESRGREPYVLPQLTSANQDGFIVTLCKPHTPDVIEGYVVVCRSNEVFIGRGNRSRVSERLYYLVSWTANDSIGVDLLMRCVLPQLSRLSSFYLICYIAAYNEEHTENLITFARMKHKLMQIRQSQMPFGGKTNCPLDNPVNYFKVIINPDLNQGYIDGEVAKCLLD